MNTANDTLTRRHFLQLAALTPLAAALPAYVCRAAAAADAPLCISGVYPHLAFFNTYGECGIGGIVPWAGKLWAITYPPHLTKGSTDKLYEIDEQLNLTARPESVGGTHACRLIHRESNQLIIGVYFIDAKGNVRAADLEKLTGRMTGIARHLTDPANLVYIYDMEGAVYEVNVHTLDVKKLFAKPVPGWHGKGAYSSQGRLVISNNGESAAGKAPKEYLADWPANDPEAAGLLAEYDGKSWRIIERRQFTEVTGPGGINGNAKDTDPIWATGWDKRSVILKLLDGGVWHTFRMPKASHAFDPKHGWFTEWPRIREVGPGTAIMTMHGMLWNFPLSFSAANTAGIRAICSHLRYVTDVCTWNNRLVISSDDTSIMANPMAGISQSNMWFPPQNSLTNRGPRAGWGGPWMDDAVKAGEPSVPFLVNGFDRRVLHLAIGSRFSTAVEKTGATRCTGALPITELPTDLASLARVSVGRGTMSKPAAGYSFTVNQEVTVFLAVDSRPKAALDAGWEKTTLQVKWDKSNDDVYRKTFPAGRVEIPPHPAEHAPASYGVPHLAFLKPPGEAAKLEVTELPKNGGAFIPAQPAAPAQPASNPMEITFTLEIDAAGNGKWSEYQRITVPKSGYTYFIFPADFKAQWLRLKADKDCTVTAYLHQSDAGHDPKQPALFAALADVSEPTACGGLLRPSVNQNLLWAATLMERDAAKDLGVLEVNGKLAFAPATGEEAPQVKELVKVNEDEFTVDDASVVMKLDGTRYRLPKGPAQYDRPFATGRPRCTREVESERNLMNAHGTFYEKPRTLGLPLIKPIASHTKQIMDFCTWRGLLVMSGTRPGAGADGQFFAGDDKRGLWFGAVDDLWQLGKPIGKGGPWLKTAVKAGASSDPYLMTGYDQKTLELSHDASEPVEFLIEVDFDHHHWVPLTTLKVLPGQPLTHKFEEGFSAHWVRLRASKACTASAVFTYA
ncbi:MAG: hypothetical protein WCO56_15395 [Verrucomicrobiota bacterium]